MKRRAPLLAVGLAGLLATAGCAGTVPTEDPAAAVSDDDGLVQPGTVHLGSSSVDASRPVVLRAQQLYAFWNTGDASWLELAVDDSFLDRPLPEGRPQGPEGPIAASEQFRAAVPDLACSLDDLYVTGDTFTARLTFTGHFTGVSGGVQGEGRPIEFGAIDIQHIGASGRIVEDWHLEDDLTFQQQAGLLLEPTS
ncbi:MULTISPECIES: ester cyclase [unclassified Rathayibacter]|uniref:ester cyclase n=1 Tax=unclassified Rathayibacter TaxID=2609250 RepID=UPI000F93EC7D|nr:MULTISPECIES: ester cyclase [unclassified Rathayibacter]ROP49314.1 putative ester cyclase [Rathayibacter sp. PhB186]ROS50569.1 putative ester cyclase [Rathayibacter sp. PhB185]